MKTFTLQLQSASQHESISDVNSFSGEDASGSFGIMADHARFITSLQFGLVRFRCANQAWEYLALPGGLLYFDNNVLTLNTRHFVRGKEYAEMSAILDQQLRREEENLRTIKHSIHHMEDEILKRMWELRKSGSTVL